MINLVVSFKYETLGSEPETGVGAVDVNVDKLPETIEEWREIARTIGTMRTPEKTEDYASVDIIRIAVVDKITPDTGEVLEGEIVI
jgi:hypothetical protein